MKTLKVKLEKPVYRYGENYAKFIKKLHAYIKSTSGKNYWQNFRDVK